MIKNVHSRIVSEVNTLSILFRVELVAQEEISKPILSIQLTSPQSGDGTLKILYNDNSSNETHHTLWLAVMGAWDISDGERYDSFEIVSKLSQPSDSEGRSKKTFFLSSTDFSFNIYDFYFYHS